MDQITLDGINLSLAGPVELNLRWVGQEELLTQLLAAWMVIDERDIPFNPRLIGKPGSARPPWPMPRPNGWSGPVYLFQATHGYPPRGPDRHPGDRAGWKNPIRCLIAGVGHAYRRCADPGRGQPHEREGLGLLAPLLDDRRYVESIITGLRIPAKRDFRIVVTMNEDSSTFEIPEYIHSRLQPQIYIDFPEADEELIILKENLPFADSDVLKYVVGFLQRAHGGG